MSGIAGIINFDDRSADRGQLLRMTSALAHRGPDGAGYWSRGSVALGHCMLHTTPESLLEQQPLTDETGALCLVFDGRLDNRAELRKELAGKGARLRSNTDSELILRAYEIWGEQAPVKLLGDFAFALWDSRNRQLVCARDPLGVKPFYYYSDRSTFLFASELHALVLHPSLKRVPNEGMVGEYLANTFVDCEETLFQNVLRLPQATCMVVRSDGRIRKSEYWRVDPARETRYRNDAEYAEAFREIFEETVRCRMRSHLPIGSELSGGLDSSSIISVAESQRRQGLIACSGLEAFSLVFPGLECDESNFIDAVTGKWGVASNRFQELPPNLDVYREELGRYQECLYPPNGHMHHPIMMSLRSKGMRVLLSGSWGDQWLTGSLDHNADMLRRLQVGKLLRQVRDDAYIGSVPGWPQSAGHMFLRYGVWPLLPESVRRGAKVMLRGDREGVPRWIGEEFARRAELSERIRQRDAVLQRWPTLAQRDIERYITSGKSAYLHEGNDRFAAAYGIEVRYPFLDRRLIEFAMGLPETQRWRARTTKFVMRQAMKGILPELVRQRTTKAQFSHVIVRALQSFGGEEFFSSLETARLGWVDGEQVRSMYQSVLFENARQRVSSYLFPLWYVLGLELWKRHAFSERTPGQEEDPLAGVEEREGVLVPTGRIQ